MGPKDRISAGAEESTQPGESLATGRKTHSDASKFVRFLMCEVEARFCSSIVVRGTSQPVLIRPSLATQGLVSKHDLWMGSIPMNHSSTKSDYLTILIVRDAE